MGNKNNPEQLEIVFRAKKLLFRELKQLFPRTSWCSEWGLDEAYKTDLFPVPTCLFSEAIKTQGIKARGDARKDEWRKKLLPEFDRDFL